jgi:hypothetical protein
MALGNDQVANQFQLSFPNGIPGGGNAQRICLRMDQSFDPPEMVSNVYELIFRGVKIPKTGMLDETTKESTFDVLIDQQWGVYDDLWNWKVLCYDGQNGTALPDAVTRTTFLVQALDGQNNVVKTFRFRNAKCKSVKVGTFDNTSGDPLRVTLILIWTDMIPE